MGLKMQNKSPLREMCTAKAPVAIRVDLGETHSSSTPGLAFVAF